MKKSGPKASAHWQRKMEEYRKSPQLKPQRSSGRYDGRDNTADQWRRPSSGGAARTSSAASPGSAPSSSVSTSSSERAHEATPLSWRPARSSQRRREKERRAHRLHPQTRSSSSLPSQSGAAESSCKAASEASSPSLSPKLTPSADSYAREKMASSKERKLWAPSSTTGADKDSQQQQQQPGRRSSRDRSSSRGRDEKPREQGIVALLRDRFGFINCVSREEDMFFHFDSVVGGMEKSDIKVGDEVDFAALRTSKGSHSRHQRAQALKGFHPIRRSA